MRIWKNPNFYLVIGLVVIAILFYSSSQTYQQQSQIGLLSKVLKNEPFKEQLSGIQFMYAGSEVSIQSEGYFSFVEFFIRKGAHFLTYFVMAGSFCLALFYKMKSIWWSAFFAWLAATGYAGLDEYHQMLTGGRTPLFQDILLDSAGALTGVLLVLLVVSWRKKR
ncbi:VanZ family protein [Enterococcus songbeiensis]|uniref:VanZ family protein n=1 Tax=Enterococcus songbeiensis TaxID=2559927 RepID=UPI0010F66730|nr:VanZ family protein [Enterococcus songbeiensis]